MSTLAVELGALRERVRAAQHKLAQASYEEDVAFALLRRARSDREHASEELGMLVTELARWGVPC